MTCAERARSAQSIGWLTSFFLHGTLALGALILTQRMTLAPPPPPFTWNVAIVATPSDSPQRSAALPDSIRPSVLKSRSEARLPNSTRPVLAKPQAAAEDPMPAEHQVPSVSLERTEQQSAVEEETASAQAITSTLASPQSESSSEPVSFAPSTQPALLSETIMRRMEELKSYPTEGRLNRAEGKVVLKAVIRDDGNVEGVEVFQSSGHQSLDRAALELLQLAAPFHLPRPMQKPQ